MKNNSSCFLVLAFSMFLGVLGAQAAVINWGSATAVGTGGGNSSDVSVTGSLVEAFNAQPNDATAANVTVNGVTFMGTTALLNADPKNGEGVDLSAGTHGGDAAYDALLSELEYGGSPAATIVIGGGALLSGSQYEVQVWFVDDRVDFDSRVMRYGDGNGNTVDLNDQFSMGTFRADGTTQSLTLAPQGFGQAHISAYQVRSLEPFDPVPPTGVVATPADEEVRLGWIRSFHPDFSYFSIRRSFVEGGPYSEIGTSTSPSYTDADLTNGEMYYYVVVSVQTDSSETDPSVEVSSIPEVQPIRPNFVFILADDQDTYSVNAYRETEPCEVDASGNPYPIHTPNIDRLATEGMIFHQARLMGANQGAVCTPSRHTIMTGRNTWHMTVNNAEDTLPGRFNVEGYDTFRTCKSGNSYDFANGQFDNGFNAVASKRDAGDGAGSDWHADKVLGFLETRYNTGDTDPFLIYFGFSHPHDPRRGRSDLLAKYAAQQNTNPSTIPLNNAAPPLPTNWLGCTPATYPAHPFDHGHLDVRDEVSVEGMLKYRTEAVVRNEIGKNFACVDWIDQQIGRVLAKLEDPNGDGDTSDSELDNTYIIYTSDHGIAIGRHGIQGKQNLYEHTWRVPYIIRGPGIAPGSETDALVYLHDTFPTLCDLAGIAPPTTIGENDGKSFKPVLLGTTNTVRKVLYGLYAGGSKPGIRAVTDGRWKLIKYDVTSDTTQHTQLFDLETNPFELLPEHGVPNLAENPAYSLIRQHMEELLMAQRNLNVDPYAYLGDRVIYRFEEGSAGQDAGLVTDFLAWENDGTAMSGNSSALPVYSSDVSAPKDSVVGEANAMSLDFEQDNQNYVSVAHSREFSFGAAPYTIEAWVALETLPSGLDLASTMPVVMKKVIPFADSQLDYLFLATAGQFGSGSNFANLGLITANGSVISSLSIPDTNWHHISVSFDPVADTVRFTMDDQVDIRTGITFSGLANTGPLVIGAHIDVAGNVDSAFDGLMDEVSVSAGYLSLEELQPLLNIPDPEPVRLSLSAIAADGLTLQYACNPLHLYEIESKQRLSDPEWKIEQSFVWSAALTNSLTLSTPTSQMSKFYRVRTNGPQRP